jgi:hypothetical protein
MSTINKGDLPRYENGEYGQSELTQAVANAEVAALLNPSSGGGGGGSTTVNFGTKITDATIPTGGVGNLGWLSAIWKLISDRIPPRSAYESSTTIAITRAATTTYSASASNFDVYGGLFQLQNIGEAGKGIFLSYFEISLDLSSVPTGMTSFAVHLYPTAPTTIADNSIWTIGSDPVLDPVGFSVSMSLAKGGGKVVGVIKDLNQLFILTSSSLWGYLVTNGAIVPTANSETGTIRARSFAP